MNEPVLSLKAVEKTYNKGTDKAVPVLRGIDLDLPAITRTILDVVTKRLQDDPSLAGNPPIPEFRMRGKTFVCEHRT